MAAVCSRITAIINKQHKQQQEQGQEAEREADNKQKQHQQHQCKDKQQRDQQQTQRLQQTSERVNVMLLATSLLQLSHALVNIWPSPALLAAALAPVTGLLAPMAVAVLREAQALAAVGSTSKETVELCRETAAAAACTGITALQAITQIMALPQTEASTACLKKFSASEDVLLLLLVNLAGAACLQHRHPQGIAATAAASSSVYSSSSSSSSSSSYSLPTHHQQLLLEFGLQPQHMWAQQCWWLCGEDAVVLSVRTLRRALSAAVEMQQERQQLFDDEAASPIPRHLVLPLVQLLADLTARSTSPELLCNTLETMKVCINLLADSTGLVRQLQLQMGLQWLRATDAAAALQAVLSCAPAVQRLLQQPATEARQRRSACAHA
jgi:hypothetical protein